MSEQELLVVLNRKVDSGFGISLLGQPGLPPIIYNILEDSPAAESGEVEVGDVILKVNETDVNRFTTKEVLKCLRLSQDPVTLKIKRDPKIKASVRKHRLGASPCDNNVHSPAENRNRNISHIPVPNRTRPLAAVHQNPLVRSPPSRNGTNFIGKCDEMPLLSSISEKRALVAEEIEERLHWEPLAAGGGGGRMDKDGGGDVRDENFRNNAKLVGGNNGKEESKQQQQPKFEAYMMTGEHILNISRTPPVVAIVPKQQKKIDSLRYHNSHTHHLRHQPLQPHPQSVPNSPNEMDIGHHKTTTHHQHYHPNSASTSPTSANKSSASSPPPPPLLNNDSTTTTTTTNKLNNFVRTSRSEDQLQNDKCTNASSSTTASNDNLDDEDITSSLNTLLDTREVLDKIVWTYNAPQHHRGGNLSNGGGSSSNGTTPSSPTFSSPSPTSMSSSVMSSQGSNSRHWGGKMGGVNGGGGGGGGGLGIGGGDFSEAISNISSPDYKDEDSMGMRDLVMECSDHSDSDSTLMAVSEPRHGGGGGRFNNNCGRGGRGIGCCDSRGCGGGGRNEQMDLLQENYEIEDDYSKELVKSPSPQSSEDESDVESLHSFHYSPKAVDLPSAIRLAKRLYSLDGFKKSDVSRHLSKNNDFSRAVAEEYLKYFNFERDSLDIALRKFLKQFSLIGETQERERVLVHFSRRYLDCNIGAFNSQDAVHTLTCAIMLLNTDLHGQNMNRKMICNEFIDNLAGLNESENFPKEILKQLYHAIKNYPLEWALDEETEENNGPNQTQNNQPLCLSGGNPFLDLPVSSNAVEYKKGFVMRKCCYEANAKRTPFHKRSWKMFYCTLRDLVLYLHKDEHGFRKNQMGDNFHNAIRVHHALATKASDYTKKLYVFRLQTADQAEYLFQTSDSMELQSWIDTINFVCASFSAPPLEAAVGSQKKFQRPLLPCSHTKLNLREQLRDHEERVQRLEAELDEHRKTPPEKGSKSLIVQNYKEKEAYLNYEVKRYWTYSNMLRSRITQYPELAIPLVENSIGEVDEATGISLNETSPLLQKNTLTTTIVGIGGDKHLIPPPIPERSNPSTPSPTNRRGID